MPPAPSKVRIVIAAVAAAALAIAFLLSLGTSNSIGTAVTRLTDVLASQGWYGELVFVVVLALVCIVGIVPASTLAVAAGGVYGLLTGIFLGTLGISVGGIIGFVLARSLFRDLVHPWVNRHVSVRAIEADIAEEGWKLVVLLRLSPVAPFGITSYALGLTQLAFVDYLLGTLGSIPALVAYVYVGVIARRALQVADARAVSWLKLGLLGVGVVATLIAGVHMYRVLRGSGVKARAYRVSEDQRTS
jgi:uncharacterized membrane protein YdjX (TVP38/TMEM64 family)